jgi:multicomponent K+:H+ antiporter subunit D
VTLAAHWPIVPLLLPLLAGIALVLLARAPLATQRAVAALATLAQLGTALVLLDLVGDGAQFAYAVGDWAAPFGIFLLVDRLAAWMLLTTAVLACVALLYSFAGEDREGPWFHALFQFQLLGINGAFATADLFNLFVFFEILLIASYALLLHGANVARTRAAVHVVVLNLVGSALFLVAVACIYAAVGTLSLADLAVKAPAVAADRAALLHVGGYLLLVVFALKAAALPLGFWLPGAYSAAPAAVAALFAVLTKVGVYAILRLYTLAFPCFDVGPCGPSGLVMPLGMATVIVGALGALAASRLRPMVGHLVLVSLGTLLVAVGTFREFGQAAAVYYVAHSTFAGAAMFLVADLVARRRGPYGDRLDAGPPLRGGALLPTLYVLGMLALVGLPPLSGFLGKLAVMQATTADAERVWPVLLVATLVMVVVGARAGSALFWRAAESAAGDAPVAANPGSGPAPWPARAAATSAVGLLIALTLAAGPALEFGRETARQLLERRGYVEAVFGVGSLSAPVEREMPVLPRTPALAEAEPDAPATPRAEGAP